jgi:Chitobiase/beta-hexosaminidase C-terminal domain
MIKYTGSLILFLFFTLYAVSQQLFQLAPPFIKYSSVFFMDEVKVSLLFAQPGTIIRYTVNSNEPTENDKEYKEPIQVNKNFTTVKAKVFGKDFTPSETAEATFVKAGLPLKNIEYPAPDESNTGEGKSTLMDNKGGISLYSTKTWLGFRQDTVSITISLYKKQKIKSILFDLLQDYDSWIFLPEKAEVYSIVKENGGFEKSGEMNFVPEKSNHLRICKPHVLRFKRKVKTDKIKLQLYLLKRIPDWHPGKGEKSWIFIDEVKVY